MSTSKPTTPRSAQIIELPRVDKNKLEKNTSAVKSAKSALADNYKSGGHRAVSYPSMDFGPMEALSQQITLSEEARRRGRNYSPQSGSNGGFNLASLRNQIHGNKQIVEISIPRIPAFRELTQLAHEALNSRDQRESTLEQISIHYSERKKELKEYAAQMRSMLQSPNISEVRTAQEGLEIIDNALIDLQREVNDMETYRADTSKS